MEKNDPDLEDALTDTLLDRMQETQNTPDSGNKGGRSHHANIMDEAERYSDNGDEET